MLTAVINPVHPISQLNFGSAAIKGIILTGTAAKVALVALLAIALAVFIYLRQSRPPFIQEPLMADEVGDYPELLRASTPPPAPTEAEIAAAVDAAFAAQQAREADAAKWKPADLGPLAPGQYDV